MLERRRATRSYHAVPGDDDNDQDVELGDAIAHSDAQETGIIPASSIPNVTEELDNWDENAEDWDEDPAEANKAQGTATTNLSVEGEAADSKKRSD